MSRVEILLLDAQRVQITAELDLTRAFGSSTEYHAASQIVDPLQSSKISEQLRRAAAAIELQAGGRRVVLVPVGIDFTTLTLAEYQSPLEWPRATIVFHGQLSAGSDPTHTGVHVRFGDGFVFEEPIATTLQSMQDDRVVSRWLVTFQSSPQLEAPLWFAIEDLPFNVAEQPSATNALGRYFNLGFWHILPAGADHLLFLLAILLGLHTLRALLVALSLYTVAHTITFAAAMLGWLPVGMFAVEPLIILSIVCAALFSFSDRTPVLGHRMMTFCFGLLHGLGFASALEGAGLPAEQRLLSLLGFNLGVESAQLLFVVLMLPLWWWRKYPWYPNRVRRPLAGGIALIGIGWLVLA